MLEKEEMISRDKLVLEEHNQSDVSIFLNFRVVYLKIIITKFVISKDNCRPQDRES